MYKREFFWLYVALSLGTLQAVRPRLVMLGRTVAVLGIGSVIASLTGYKGAAPSLAFPARAAGCGCERRSVVPSRQVQQPAQLSWLQQQCSGADEYPGLQP